MCIGTYSKITHDVILHIDKSVNNEKYCFTFNITSCLHYQSGY